MASIKVFPDLSVQTQAAIHLFISLAKDSILKRGAFSVALSGGGTPKKLYAGLTDPELQGQLAWSDIHLFFGDERHVPPDHPDSNFRMVQKTLLSRITIPESNVHRVMAELDPRIAAFNYEEMLRGFFDFSWPRFDLVLLGMGEDGHTASLFPGTAGSNEEQRWFIANYVPKQGAWRLTLSKNAINAARNIVVLVSGRSKAEKLSEVLLAESPVEENPIQMISPRDGEMLWLLDREAASQLPNGLII